MALTDMVPWGRKKGNIRAKHDFDDVMRPFRQEINNLLGRFFGDWSMDPFAEMEPPGAGFAPHVDVKEDDKEIRITAELPGMDEDDIDVALSQNCLTITGEKTQASEDKGKNYYSSERRYGSFQRVIPLIAEIDENKVEATFRKGVLSLRLPKTEEARKQQKKIEVKGQ